MSRSNPNVNAPNPAVRWFEWNGEDGLIRYYDKDAKQNVDVGAEFQFLLLDQMGSVRGWHDASDSGIYSNEVRDTRTGVLIVKAFKGGTLAEGVYRAIKDHVNAVGGQFVANCYIAFRHEKDLAIGSLRLKGATLGAWMDFCQAHRADLYTKAIAISGYTEGKKGRIVFRVPKFAVAELSAETHDLALALDRTLQSWLTEYCERTTHEQAPHGDAPDGAGHPEDKDQSPPLTDDDIPF